MIRKNTIVESLENALDIVAGKRYITIEDHPERAVLKDDHGYTRYRPSRTFKVVGHIDDVAFVAPPSLKDIHGQKVVVGDYVAYASTGTGGTPLDVFEVQVITKGIALCRSTRDSAIINLGAFEERALKLKDYNK